MADGEGVDLLRVEQARAWLAECIKVDECKDFRDKAQAVAAYKRSRGASVEVQADGWELVQRADRRLGELLKSIDFDRGGRPKKTGSSAEPVPPRLAEMGVDKKQSHRWQKKAALPEDEFEQRIAAGRQRIERTVDLETLTTASDAPDYDGDEASTPQLYADAASEVLGTIELDVASNAYAQNVIRAERFYTKQDSGLLVPWKAKTLWMNAPYSTRLVQAFAEKWCAEREAGNFKSGIALFNSATETGWFQSMLGACDVVCFPDKRIQFEYRGEPIEGSNRYAQAFFYSGKRVNAFLKAFGKIGRCCAPILGALR